MAWERCLACTKEMRLRKGIHPTPSGQAKAIYPYFFSTVNRIYWGIRDLDTP